MPDKSFERPKGIWPRLVSGVVVLVVCAAAATAVAAYDEINKVVDAFNENQKLDLGPNGTSEADFGDPQTIMLVGSDKRPKGVQDGSLGPKDARSDTVILVRLNPRKGATALLSLPRDLRVEIPGHGTDKLNAAYTIGGIRLTLKTVKAITGLRVNHVINVDLEGFKAAVDRIKCVYMDIDRYYLNDKSAGQDYAPINIKQGYQRLCGQKALDYVRFRHEDNDIVRAGRQQEFLRQAKAQVGIGRVISDRDKLVRIFGKYTQSDISSRQDVLELLELAIQSLDKPIQEVHFKGKIGRTYVTASSARMRRLADEFLDVRATKGPRGSLRPDRPRRRRERNDAPLEDAQSAGREQALQVVAQGARFPVYYPRKRTRGALFAGEPRFYAIRSRDQKVHKAYRMVIKRGTVGEYYGLQGTTWKKPPILDDPSGKRTIGGREYELHYDGDRLRLVAWRTPKAVYWISNTLLLSLTRRQMLSIARSARAL